MLTLYCMDYFAISAEITRIKLNTICNRGLSSIRLAELILIESQLANEWNLYIAVYRCISKSNSSVDVQGNDGYTAAMLALSGVWMRLCQVESPLQERVRLVC